MGWGGVGWGGVGWGGVGWGEYVHVHTSADEKTACVCMFLISVPISDLYLSQCPPYLHACTWVVCRA